MLRSGSRVRVTLQVVDARTAKLLWAEAYERDLHDIIALQSDIADAVSRQVATTLAPQVKSTLKRRPIPPEAYEAYLKGRYYLNRRDTADLKKSEKYFQDAIERDPTYASAYTGLADSYEVLGSWEGGILPPKEAFPKAIAAYEKALEIDGTLADAHSSLGYAKLYYYWDWAGAEKEFKRAIELNPNSETAHHWYSHYLLSMGRTEESLAESKRGIQLAPFDSLGRSVIRQAAGPCSGRPSRQIALRVPSPATRKPAPSFRVQGKPLRCWLDSRYAPISNGSDLRELVIGGHVTAFRKLL